MNLAGISIKQPVFVTMMMLVLVVVGYLGYSQLAVNLFPDTTNPTVSVSTDYPGASPQEVAEQVTQPLEASVASLSGVTNIRSTSREGTSDINIDFTLETDPKQAFQDVSQRISRAQGRLPNGAGPSTVARFDSASIPILSIVVADTAGKLKSYELRNMVINQIQPRIERVNGVGQVSVFGGQDREIDVNLSLDQLRSRRVSVSQVVSAISAENVSIPGGIVTQGNQDLSLRMPVQFTSIDDIANLYVNGTRGGPSVKIKDIGTVVDTTAPVVSYSRLNGQDSVQIQVQKQSGTNTVQVAQDVKTELARVQRDFKGLKFVMANDQSDFIQKSIVDSVSDLITGAIFASLVVLLFFGGLRKTLITSAVFGAVGFGTYLFLSRALALPLPFIIFILFAELLVLLFFIQRNTFVTVAGLPVIMIGTFAVLNGFGLSLNMMTLLALSLAVGLVLDDAIVVRENIFRHMEHGQHPKDAARDGTNEVSLSVIAMSLTIVSVFLPIAFTTGQIGRFYREFGIAVTAAVLISLFEAFTLAPMLSAYLFKEQKHKPGHEKAESEEELSWLDKIYRSALGFTLNHTIATTVVAFVAISAVVFLWRYMEISFLPRLDNGNFQVGLQLPPGTTLAVTDAQSKKIEAALLTVDGVDNVLANVGGGSTPESARFNVLLKTFDLRGVETQVRNKLKGIDGLSYNFQGGFGGGGTNVGQRPVQVFLLSTGSFDDLNNTANAVADQMSKIDGVRDVALSTLPGKPEFQITADRTKTSLYGFTSTTVGNAIRTLVAGSNASVYNDPGKEANIIVRLRPEDRSRIDDILSLTLANASGQVFPLRNLVTTANGSGPSVITRLNRQTQIIVGGNLQGRSQAQVLADLRPLLTKMQANFPAGVTWQFGGQIQQTQDSFNTLIFSLTLSIIFMYMVLASQFGSFSQPIVLMLALPFAIFGAFAALLITRTGADMTALIGMMLLMGLAVKNSILLVDFTNRLRAQGMSRREALLTAGPVRLRPVLMTTMALILGMLPVAIGAGAGGSFRAPMATAVIGGLITSTILTLLFVPVAYSVLDIIQTWVSSLRSKPTTTAVESGARLRQSWLGRLTFWWRPQKRESLELAPEEQTQTATTGR